MKENSTDKQTEEVRVHRKNISCDGGVLGHPRIYLNMGEADKITCPYCSRVFVYDEKAR